MGVHNLFDIILIAKVPLAVLLTCIFITLAEFFANLYNIDTAVTGSSINSFNKICSKLVIINKTAIPDGAIQNLYFLTIHLLYSR